MFSKRLHGFWLSTMLLILCTGGGWASAGEDHKHEKSEANNTLVVHVNKIRNDNGKIIALLFKEKKGYPSDVEAAYKTVIAAVENKRVQLNFEGLPKDDFVVSLFHDEDDDGELDRRWYGAPKEGVGVSNNIQGKRGPPDFDKSRFKLVQSKQEINIEMHYP